MSVLLFNLSHSDSNEGLGSSTNAPTQCNQSWLSSSLISKVSPPLRNVVKLEKFVIGACKFGVVGDFVEDCRGKLGGT